MPAAAVGAVATIGGSLIAANGQKKAAKTAAGASQEASQMLINETRMARIDVLNTMVPALKDYGNEIDNLQQYVADGTIDVMKTLTQTSVNAMQIMQQSGSNARKALLGSAAGATGMPRQQFDQTYSQVQGLPPAQQDQILREAFPDAYGTFESQKIAPTDRTAMAETGIVPPTPQAPSAPQPTIAQPRQLGGRTDFFGRPISQRLDRGGREDLKEQQSLFGYQPPTALPQSPLAGVAAATPTPPGRPEIQYSGYQDRGTPGFDVDVSGVGTDIYGPQAVAAGTGFFGAMGQLDRGEGRALSRLARSTGQAREDIRGATGEALGRLDPYSTTGREALQREAALSGALGPEAQQQAIQGFIESPGQQFMRERMEKALLRNTAATGGLGGGRVRTALMEQAMGIAATDQQRTLENLRSLAGRGQQADTTGASIIQQAGQDMARLADAFGVRSADLATMNSQQKAQLAERAGIQLAQLEQLLGAAQAGQLATLGAQLATTQAGGLADIASLGQQGATTQLQGQGDIATLLANLAVQGSTQAAGYTAQAGSQLAAGQQGSAATMGQMFKDVGNIGAYTLSNIAGSKGGSTGNWSGVNDPYVG